MLKYFIIFVLFSFPASASEIAKSDTITIRAVISIETSPTVNDAGQVSTQADTVTVQPQTTTAEIDGPFLDDKKHEAKFITEDF